MIAALIQKLRVFFLDVGRIPQHGAAQIDSGGRSVNGAAEAAFHQVRQIAAVVDMRMREDHRGDGCRRHGQVAVPRFRILAPTLISAEIEQIAIAVRLD